MIIIIFKALKSCDQMRKKAKSCFIHIIKFRYVP